MPRFSVSASCALLTLAALIVPGARGQGPPVPSAADAPPVAEVAPAAPAPAAPVITDAAPPAVRRALIVCGLPGDAEHRELFAESVESLVTGLTTHHGFALENVALYWGDEIAEGDGPALKSSRGIATRESLAEGAESLQASLRANDTLWVFVFGHSHYDGRHAWLNIAGPDLNNQEFGRFFEGLKCREQVFFITTSASGFYLKPLAAAGRVVIVATEPDLEVNETLFPHTLVKALADPPPYLEFDADRDGKLTLLDAYLWSARDIAQQYVTGELLATEHSLLDDTGDGRGTELQINYLSEELGGRLKAGQDWPAPPTGDGALARQIRLAHPPAPPVPEVQPDPIIPAPSN
ncbi:MAG TPA: hypothetical protein VFV87_11770 [Pirellulaceae bacterium]|nr:hypothetical protein [Pirellulaceae bacterium]